MLVPNCVVPKDWKKQLRDKPWGSDELLDLVEVLDEAVSLGLLDGEELDRQCKLRREDHWRGIFRDREDDKPGPVGVWELLLSEPESI